MTDLSKYQEVDGQLDSISTNLQLLSALDPVNSNEEKERFLAARSSGQVYEPQFTYRDLDYSPEDKLVRLDAIEIAGNDEVGQILNAVRRDISLQLKMLQSRGDATAMRALNSELYGAPSAELVEHAEEILGGRDSLAAQLRGRGEKSTKSQDELKADSSRSVQAEFAKYGLQDTWSVTWQNVTSSKTDVKKKQVVLSERGRFNANSALKLAIHEVGVHVLRGENGYMQPLTVFRRGFPGYLATEEGLAVYMEKIHGVLSLANYRNYAGRIIAVDSMMKGDTFNSSVDRLTAYGFTLETAYQLSMRAYRGGGFAKDQEYLQGYRMVEDFVQKGGDLTDLYYGKFDLAHLDLVRSMAENGLLTPKDKLLIPDVLRTDRQDSMPVEDDSEGFPRGLPKVPAFAN